MATRGAPRKNGVKSGAHLLRATVVLAAFQSAREEGLKFELALLAAAEAAKKTFPSMRTGATTVKRILAAFAPKNKEEMMVVKKTAAAGVSSNLMNSRGVYQPQNREGYAIGFAPRVEYARANAVKRA